MKAQSNLFLPVSTTEELREKAKWVGVGVGDLADLLLRFALERMPDDALRKWAASLPSRMGRLAGLPTKDERAVLAALESLPAKPGSEGTWCFSMNDIAAEAGLKLSPTFWALKALEKRGQVKSSELSDLDRWGRPVKSFWALVSAIPDGRSMPAAAFFERAAEPQPPERKEMVVPPLPPRPVAVAGPITGLEAAQKLIADFQGGEITSEAKMRLIHECRRLAMGCSPEDRAAIEHALTRAGVIGSYGPPPPRRPTAAVDAGG